MRKRGHMRKTEAMINEIEKVIIGKREVIEQVLMNLLENAVQHARGMMCFWKIFRESERQRWH